MIVIKDIDTIEVKGDVFDLAHFQEPFMAPVEDFEAVAKSMKYETETIRGKRFYNHNGQEISIGLSKKAKEILGLPFEVIDNLTEALYNKTCEINQKNIKIRKLSGKLEDKTNRLKKYESMNFWRKFKFLFTKNLT